MSLLIDGYNLMHATGIIGPGGGPGTLQRSRQALLRFLAAQLAEQDRAKTTVVFDARDAPAGLPRQLEYCGMQVCFAKNPAEADDLIEELIRADSAPKKLTVVSSDHRLHRAARRRRATAVDSDVWYEQLHRTPSPPATHGTASPDHKPILPLTAEEVRRWLDEFGED